MKNIYILFLAIVGMLFSCDKDEFLDKDSYNIVLTENLITDFPSLNSATAGVYNIFQSTFYYNSYYTILPDLMGDNVQALWVVFQDIDRYQTISNDVYAKRVWDEISKAIAQSSITIRQAESFNFGANQEEATKLIGQLYVARALAYFDMQRLYAQPYNFTADASHLGAPIVDERLVGIELINPARATTAEVYAKIISDIQTGMSLIGDDTSSVYYLNKNSAKALLARVYLYMENWSEANKLASEVIASNYRLVSNSDYISSWTRDFTSESIFSIVNNANDNSGTASLIEYYRSPRFRSTTNLFNGLANGDVRKSLIAASTRNVLKYPTTGAVRDNNTPIIRLSEMYLIKAEALAEMARDAEARDAINTILLRANPLAIPYTQSGDDLKNIIQEERRKELMFEGHRLFDLTRKKKSFTAYSNSAGNPIDVTYPNNLTILPIPQAEIDANTNISQGQQNAGY
jgi:hypothetical protein